jgi:hypothetical protein
MKWQIAIDPDRAFKTPHSTYKVQLLNTGIEHQSSESEAGNVSTQVFHVQTVDWRKIVEQKREYRGL